MDTSINKAFLTLTAITIAIFLILLPLTINQGKHPNNDYHETPSSTTTSIPTPIGTTTTQNTTTATTQTTITTTSTQTKPSNITLCTYFYVWYGSPDHPWTNIIDMPLLGYYNSNNTQVMTQQLEWIREAGIDCLIISWWGPGHYTDIVAQKVFQLLSQYGLQGSIMIEPWLGDEDPASNTTIYNATWWNNTLHYIQTHYIEEYGHSYLHLDGHPLILAFNPIGMKYRPNTTMYTIRIVGNDIDNARYQDWDYWPDYDKNLTGKLRIRTDGYVAITPRYDDEHFRPGNVPSYDPNLTKNWYQKQWQWILNNTQNISIITIATWNEYHERTMIEPHYDATSPIKDPYYLYNITRKYIDQIKQN